MPGENATIQSVTWTGGKVPTDEDSMFRFVGAAENPGTLSFTVRQTYSDGSVVEWSGDPELRHPGAQVEAKSSLGGGGSDTLSIIAIVVGAIGVVLGGAALLLRGGKRSLT